MPRKDKSLHCPSKPVQVSFQLHKMPQSVEKIAMAAMTVKKITIWKISTSPSPMARRVRNQTTLMSTSRETTKMVVPEALTGCKLPTESTFHSV